MGRLNKNLRGSTLAVEPRSALEALLLDNHKINDVLSNEKCKTGSIDYIRLILYFSYYFQ